MKRYIAEIVIFCIQLFMFYISPLFAGPTDGMGMVVLILFATLILSILLGSISKNRIKYVYPAAVPPVPVRPTTRPSAPAGSPVPDNLGCQS